MWSLLGLTALSLLSGLGLRKGVAEGRPALAILSLAGLAASGIWGFALTTRRAGQLAAAGLRGELASRVRSLGASYVWWTLGLPYRMLLGVTF